MSNVNSSEGTLTGKIDDGTTWSYTGGICNGLKHGKGKITWSNGDVYEGDSVDGKCTKGKYTWADGSFYIGDFVDDNFHGKGKYTWANGDVYEGDFVDDQFHGKGKFVNTNGVVVYEGNFINDKYISAENEKRIRAIEYNNRGIEYANKNALREAIADFTKAIQIDPNYWGAYSNRGNMYLRMGEFQKAISDCTKAIEISPNENMSPYYNRGLAYMNIGKASKAFDDYDKVIQLDPKNAEAYAKRGAINSELGNIQEAINDLEEFLRLDPNNQNAKLVKDELEKLKRGDGDSFEVSEAKKEIKRLNVCSIVFGIIGLVVGIFALSGGGFSSAEALGVLFVALWLGIGIGVGFVALFECFGLFPFVFKKDGFEEACKVAFGGGTLFFVLFTVAGPFGWLGRVMKRKGIIKKFR